MPVKFANDAKYQNTQLKFSKLRRSYDITLVAQVNVVAMSDVTCILNRKQEGVNDLVLYISMSAYWVPLFYSCR